MRLLGRIKAAWKLVFNRLDAAQWSYDRSMKRHPVQDARFDVTQAERETVAGHARDFELNEPIAQQLGSVFVNYTVGANGLQVSPASSDPKWNEAAKKYWNDTCKFIDLCSRQSFGVLQGLIAWRWFFDGEIFILKTRGQDASGKWRPRIQLIESHRVGTPPDMAKQEGKTVVQGIGIDGNGRPTGAWVKDASDSRTYRFIDARDYIHVFEPSRPGEYRGMTFFHSVINFIQDLRELRKFEIQAAKRNAKDITIIKNGIGEANAEDLLRTDGTTPEAADGKIRAKAYEDIFDGSSRYLFHGDEVSQNPGERASVTTLNFWDYIVSSICIGVGICKQLVFPYSIQGTVSRFDLGACSVFFKSRSGVLQAAFREVYIYVLQWGKNTEKDLADPPSDWTEVSIQSPRAPSADIGRNSAAMLAELSVGATNYDIIYGELGLDWKEQLRKSAECAKYIRELATEFGITPGEISANAGDALVKHADALKLEAEALQQEETPTA